MKKLTSFVALIVFFAVSVSFAAATPDSFVDVVKKTRDSVVNISTTKVISRSGGFPNDELFRRFFGDRGVPNHPQIPEDGAPFKNASLGSGFVIDATGYIVTNNHVIEGADEIIVKLNDKHTFPAKVIGADPLTDLALIKIEPKGVALKTIPLGNSDATEVGEWVVAIGNPLGFEWSVTAGIVSAKGRVLGEGPYDNFLQTDTSINPGNSGGPLINMKGEVVAINTAIIPSGQGMGFAVPVNMLKELLPKLKSGKVRRGWLGVSLQQIDEKLAKAFGLTSTDGALIAGVNDGDPADKAGVREGDIIIRADALKVTDTRELINYIGSKYPGDVVKLTILRDGKQVLLAVKLGERPVEKEVASSSGIDPMPKTQGPISVAKLTDAEMKSLGTKNGVRVTAVAESSAAYEAGLRAGDVVVWINRANIATPTDFTESIGKVKKGDVIAMKVLKRGGGRIVAFSKDW